MADKTQSRKDWSAASLLSGGLVLFFAYLFVPSYLREALCPRDTFLSGPIGSEIGVVGDLLIPPSFFILALLTPGIQSSASSWIKRHSVSVTIIASCTLLLSAILWINLTFSFYCATPSTILLHPDILGSYRRFPWDDVRVVQARCWSGSRTPWQGGLNVSFGNGEEILMPFGYHQQKQKQNYEAIRTALQGKTYRYDLSNIKVCPQDVYSILARWPSKLN
jgi:hypothetical protein